MIAKPKHAEPALLKVANNQLCLSGRAIDDIAHENASGPFYAYSKSGIEERISQLRQILPEDIKLHYAIKANPLPELVNFISPLVDGLDIASGGELKTALDSSMPPMHIGFAGPGKSDEELSLAIQNNVILHIESANELERVLILADVTGVTPRIAFRLNPDFELKSSGMKMAGGAKPFGIDVEQIPPLLEKIKTAGVEFLGFHIYSGSQNLDAESLVMAQNATFKLVSRLIDDAKISISYLNIGGGFGIPYFPGDQHLDLSPIAGNLRMQSGLFSKRHGRVEVALELGRYLVGEAGVYVCQIVDKKVSRGKTFLICNGGMHHHLAASGNFGQIIRKNYPVYTAKAYQSDIVETVSIVGPLCTPLDILADSVDLPRCDVGDYIVIGQSGAYGASASPQAFLGHPAVNEFLV